MPSTEEQHRIQNSIVCACPHIDPEGFDGFDHGLVDGFAADAVVEGLADVDFVGVAGAELREGEADGAGGGVGCYVLARVQGGGEGEWEGGEEG